MDLRSDISSTGSGLPYPARLAIALKPNLSAHVSAYAKLEEKTRGINRLRGIQAISGWNEACMMPSGSGRGRSQALATLTGVIHERLCDPEIGELLNTARADGAPLDAWQSANLSNIEREYVEATAVPADLVRAIRLATLNCAQAWHLARAADDWLAIQPLLEEVTGTRLDAGFYKRHLESRYLS